MISRVLLGVGLAVVMLLVGPMTYYYLGTKTSKVTAPPAKPTSATPRAQALSIPGTIYVVQSGAIYSFSAGRFHQLTPEQGWTQPTISPDGGTLIAVKATPLYSDVYALTLFGKPVRRITNNAAPARLAYDTGSNHWSFYPRLSPDQKTLWMAYDQPKFGYDVVLSIWAMPYGGSIQQGRVWTNAADYTGGDVQPVPVANNAVIYTRYDYGPDEKLVGRLWYTNRAYSVGRPLTDPSEDCRNPALSPDGRQVAMICTYEKQVSYLVIASWNGSTLGPRHVVISNQLVAQPTWAPDGSGIAYLAPALSAGPFQLWYLPRAAYAPPTPAAATPTPGASPASSSPTPPAVVNPIQITTNNGFDATSPIAWR